MRKQQSGAVKYILILIGILFVALGVIGIVVPGLPTTIFMIAAAACFAKSSPWLYNWLLSHKWFGPLIHNWNETRSISRKAKVFALLMMAIACVYTWLVLDTFYLKIAIFVIMLLPAIFVYRLPYSEDFEDLPEVIDSESSTP